MESNEDVMWCRSMMRKLSRVQKIRKERFKLLMDNRVKGLVDGSWEPPILIEAAPFEDITRIIHVAGKPPPPPPPAPNLPFPSHERRHQVMCTRYQVNYQVHLYMVICLVSPCNQYQRRAHSPAPVVLNGRNRVENQCTLQ